MNKQNHIYEFDLAIIGGGLAGLTLAIQSANVGYRVVLFEKETYPFHKVCGEYISMESHSYLQKWNVGTTIKFINSDYGPYKSNALAADIGLQYHVSSNLFSASVLVKNLGVQLKKYTNAMEEELPFDLIIGITKRLAKAPFGFSFTANNLNVFDIRYNDENFNSVNSFGQDRANKKYIFDKIFRHVILAGHIYIDSKIEFNIGYNHLRRQELGIGNSGNGLNGFSMGAGLLLNKMQIRFARTNYQNNTAFNQLGLNLQLNGYFGLGKFGEKIKW